MNLARLGKGIGVLKFLARLSGCISDNKNKYVRVIVPGNIEFWIDIIEQYNAPTQLIRLYESRDFDLTSRYTYIVNACQFGEEISNIRKVASSQSDYLRFKGCIVEVVRVGDRFKPDLSYTIQVDSYITRLDAVTVAYEVLSERNVGKVVLDKVLANVSSMVGLWDFELIERCVNYQLVDASEQSLSVWKSLSVECPRLRWEQNSEEIHPVHILLSEPSGEIWFRQYLAATQMSVIFPILESTRMDIISTLHKNTVVSDNERDELIDGDYQLLHKRCQSMKRNLAYLGDLSIDVRALYVDIRCELAHSRPVTKARIILLDELSTKYRIKRFS